MTTGLLDGDMLEARGRQVLRQPVGGAAAVRRMFGLRGYARDPDQLLPAFHAVGVARVEKGFKIGGVRHRASLQGTLLGSVGPGMVEHRRGENNPLYDATRHRRAASQVLAPALISDLAGG